MERIELFSSPRVVEKGAARRLRQEGLVPAMLYGHGVGNIPIKIEALELGRILAQAGASQLIYLQIEDGSTQPVLAREIQRDVLTGDPIHVDFLAVSMTEKITAEVSISLTGLPRPVEQGEGILLQGLNTIEIECLPGDLIPELEIDVSELDFDSPIYVEDLIISSDVTVLSDPQEVIAQIVVEEVEEEEEEEEEEILFGEEPAEVEVIGKGKVEEEEEEFEAE